MFNKDLKPVLLDTTRLNNLKSTPRAIPGMDLSHKDLRHAAAFFAHCQPQTYKCDFSGVNFSHANLSGLYLHGTMHRADFSGANLSGTHLSGDLTEAIFEGAILDGTVFDADKFAGARFADAKISHATITPLSHEVNQIIGIAVATLDPNYFSWQARKERLNVLFRQIERGVQHGLSHPLVASGLSLIILALYNYERALRRALIISPSPRLADWYFQGVLGLITVTYLTVCWLLGTVIAYTLLGLLLYAVHVLFYPLLVLECIAGCAYYVQKKNLPGIKLYTLRLFITAVAFLALFGTSIYVP